MYATRPLISSFLFFFCTCYSSSLGTSLCYRIPIIVISLFSLFHINNSRIENIRSLYMNYVVFSQGARVIALRGSV